MRLTIVVPCYNEEEVLPETSRQLLNLLENLIAQQKVASTSEICFVDDGSKDTTWILIERLAATSPHIKGIKLSRNCGHQIALLAGLMSVPGDAIVSVDADLQDDLSAIYEMIASHAAGNEIVYGVRRKRDTDVFLKRFTATSYYRVLRWMGVEVVYNHADFRLMGRRAINALASYDEVNVFLRGLIPQLGYPTSTIFYDRLERFAGESKYPLGKMLALAWTGVTSFSAAPLRFITSLGILVAIGSFAITLWALGIRLFTHNAVPGWASIVVPFYLLGGVQLFAIGLIGEYLAKIYMETKRRPRYFIERSV